MKVSKKRLRNTRPPSALSAEERLIEALERENAELRKANAKLLRMVELVMEERFYRPTVTGGVRENVQTSTVSLESLSDVATFDEDQDAALMQQQETELVTQLRSLEAEHNDWRQRKRLSHADDSADAAA